MDPNPRRPAPDDTPVEREEVMAGGNDLLPQAAFDSAEWQETRAEHDGAGGRMVLGWALIVLAAAWIGYSAWSAGRALGGVSPTSPALAEWIAVVTGPLALMGLTWLMFGRTRRKETERFTRSVIALRSETRSLEALLAVVTTRIADHHRALGGVSGELMGLGDEAARRLSLVTRELEAGTARVAEHGAALDRAAEAARTDIGVLLSDLPLAEQRAQAVADGLRGAGEEAGRQAALFEERAGTLSERTREADAVVGDAAGRLMTHLTHIESAGAAARAQLEDAASSHRGQIDELLGHAAAALDNIRSGIDAQAAAVAALVSQSSAGLGRAGQDSAEALGARLSSAGIALDSLTARIAEQERASQRLIADLDAGLAALDAQFLHLAQQGDQRAASMVGGLARLRGELTALGRQAEDQDQLVGALVERTEGLRHGVDVLSGEIRDVLGGALEQAHGEAVRLADRATTLQPTVERIRDAATSACKQLSVGANAAEAQEQRLAALLAAVDSGVGGAQARLGELGEAITAAANDAGRLSQETGPALVAALLQVREAAAHASDRAREAIAAVIPESAAQLSEAARIALEQAVQSSVAAQLHEVERVAVRAVQAAQGASERLTRQMLTIGQSASALEAHIERNQESQRQHDSDEFAKRVSQLIDSMHSASIDVGKILADEIDDKAWTSYLKGNRGVFTRRAARLIGASETRAIQTHYESDPEFAASVNRYVRDFESLLRRVLAERDGGMIAVTMMSSDVGKLYAALAQAVERRR